LRVFEYRVLRILGPKWEEVTRGWRRRHNEELHNLYASPNIFRVIKSRKMRWAGGVACIVEVRNAYRVFVGKPQGKRRRRRPRRKWKDNLRLDLREIGWDGVDRIPLAQDGDQWRVLVHTVMNFRVAYKAGNFSTS
jgi:hypothetical protein